MAKTKLGQKVQGWTPDAKEEFKTDLDKLNGVPPDALRAVVDKIAKTYPACNSTELAILEAEQRGLPDSQALSDFAVAFTYLWENIEGEPSGDVIADLNSVGLISNDAARVLTALLASAEPFRESAKVASEYLRIGAALFVGFRGTVDLRLRFHKTEEEFSAGKLPTELISAQPVILANLTINEPGGFERIISFLMDESDLSYLKRFVRNMEKEMELSRSFTQIAGGKK